MQRFIHYIEDTHGKIPSKALSSSIRLNIVDREEYNKKIKAFNEILNDLPKESIYSPPSKDSYAIFTICLPYGEIFKSIIKKNKPVKIQE